jgi:hypothetical protein
MKAAPQGVAFFVDFYGMVGAGVKVCSFIKRVQGRDWWWPSSGLALLGH